MALDPELPDVFLVTSECAVILIMTSAVTSSVIFVLELVRSRLLGVEMVALAISVSVLFACRNQSVINFF